MTINLGALFAWLVAASSISSAAISVDATQQPLGAHEDVSTAEISDSLFASLERMSRVVDIAYCIGTSGISKPFQCVSRCKEFPGFELAKTWHTGYLKTDSCGYIAVDHGSSEHRGGPGAAEPAVYVVFRGTYSITNMIVDLSTQKQEYVPYPRPGDGEDEEPSAAEAKCTNCTVHSGFLESWSNARTIVLPVLQDLRTRYPEYPLRLVGHSLGGAVAALAALDARATLGWGDMEVTTFGEPKVGNEGLAGYIDDIFDLKNDNTDPEARRFRRVTHSNDPVPLLPFTEWGYRAHAGEIYIAKEDLPPAPEDLRVCEGDEDKDCIAGSDDSLIQQQFTRGLLSVDVTPVEASPEFPTRWKLWELFYAHRDYFWRVGLCSPSF